MKKTPFVAFVVLLIMAVLLAACGSGSNSSSGPSSANSSNSSTPSSSGSQPAAPDRKPIKIGSKNNLKSALDAELYSQVMESVGVKVDRMLNLGGTMITFESLKNNEIDMYPEYTGTGLLAILQVGVQESPEEALRVVREGFKQWNIEWLEPSTENSTYGFATMKETAEKYGLKTISDLNAKASELTLSYPQEFDVRDDGIPGLQKHFKDQGGFKFKKQFQVDFSLRYEPLLQGLSDVTVSELSDGEVYGHQDIVLIEDDIGFFPLYNPAPIIRKEVLDQYPEIVEPLNRLSSLLNTNTKQELNWKVAGPEKIEIEDVAREFLKKNGFIQ